MWWGTFAPLNQPDWQQVAFLSCYSLTFTRWVTEAPHRAATPHNKPRSAVCKKNNRKNI